MKICYFTLTSSTPTRDVVCLNGLRRLGAEIIECRDDSPGLKKFWRLWKKHRALKNDYDLLLVGFSGHILVPFARLISNKKIIFNTLGGIYNGVIDSRKKYGFWGLNAVYCLLVDWLAFHSAHLSFTESDARKKQIAQKFFVPERKLARMWPGVDDNIFIYNPSINKRPSFTVLFRGALMPESGIKYMLQAAHILRNHPVNFLILGGGYLAPLVTKMIKDFNLKNIEWITEKLLGKDISIKMQECHVSLGQLSNHKRQNFHLPFKAFESMALKIPYLTARVGGILELLTENKSCFCANPADSQDLADKILWIKKHPEQQQSVAENAYKIFQNELTTEAVARQLKKIIKNHLNLNLP